MATKRVRYHLVPGQQFTRLTLVEQVSSNPIFWRCRCVCGTETVVSQANLIRGMTRSCSCLQKDKARQTCTTHGLSDLPEYRIWSTIRDRCVRSTCKSFKDYGGRGITLCDRWLYSFENFIADVGRRPAPDLSIDRIDVNGNYEPGNVRWATASEQQTNKRRRTHCLRGHPFDEEHTYVIPGGKGHRSCRTCTNAKRRERRKAGRHR